MRILFLAPQPFYQERGTPIAVRLALEVLTQRSEDSIDLLTYHEGQDIKIPQLNVRRIKAPAALRNIGPGISWKKILCDVIFLFTALHMVWTARRQQYSVVHAVEESVFIACIIRAVFGIPYIYDMDSSLALQVSEKWYLLRPFQPVLNFFERCAVRFSTAVVPVCDALAAIAEQHGSAHTHILRDISLLDLKEYQGGGITLRQELNLNKDHKLVVYNGNLERYQGVELLIEAFGIAAKSSPEAHLIVIGGRDEHIQACQAKALLTEVSDRIHLLGPRPVSRLRDYLLEADILTSPRIRGNNTPMKIYSYLHSGRAIIATDLPTHSQVLNEQVALLCPPTVVDFAKGLEKLLGDPCLCDRLGKNAYQCAHEKYTFEIFQTRLNELYDMLGQRLSLNAHPASQH